MPDLAPVVGGLFDLLTPILGPALRAFLRTTAGMLLLGLVLAGASFYWAAQGSVLRGALACALAFGLCAAIGFVLAGKRAVGRGLLHGVQRLGLGQRLLGTIFDRLPGSKAARSVETLPLAQAEARLAEAVHGLLAAQEQGGGLGGWLRRKLQARMLLGVQQLTLARFRQAGSEATGIDLVKVRGELAGSVDRLLGDKIHSAVQSATVLLVVLAVLLSLAGAYGIRQLPI